MSSELAKVSSWASYQISKIAGCACAGNAGNVFPRRRFQRKPLISDPGMHHGTCVTHVPWCMSGSLTCGYGENVPGIPGACAPAILRIWQEAHWHWVKHNLKPNQTKPKDIQSAALYAIYLPAELSNADVSGKEFLCIINTVLGGVIRGGSVDCDTKTKTRTMSHWILPFLYKWRHVMRINFWITLSLRPLRSDRTVCKIFKLYRSQLKIFGYVED